jgi:hypothetical protein
MVKVSACYNQCMQCLGNATWNLFIAFYQQTLQKTHNLFYPKLYYRALLIEVFIERTRRTTM